ncbi:MAG TPA: metallophosphoesterase family protein [Gaiellaceae bacterium]|jgi:diadenosine tetraphosphatase ApaH/serine/threonine PP2A family protein phosphatase
MRVAVISDIHANLHALEAVLADVDAQGVDELWCLGDTVGYGPRPNECCDVVRARAALSLCGNHDLAVLGELDVGEFTGDAAAAARWTAGVIGDEQRTWLSSLSPLGRRDEAQLFHASPRDPIWEYVLSEHAALLAILETEARVVLVGHSHVALALSWDGKRIDGGLAAGGASKGLGRKRWLLNPGSVGQPRDGDPRAAWLLLDAAGRRASFRRVDYDVERTQQEIRDHGLPDPLASRLAHGV